MIAVVDSGPLIALSKANLLFILREIFKEVYMPPAVKTEVVDKGKGLPGADEVRQAGWIKVKEVKDILACEALKHELGKGDAIDGAGVPGWSTVLGLNVLNSGLLKRRNLCLYFS